MIEPGTAVRQMIQEKEKLDYAARCHARTMAELLMDNLKECLPHQLKKMKKELKKYNIHTGTWKE